MSLNRHICELCGNGDVRVRKEQAHIIPGGRGYVKGCKCRDNMVNACKYPCHRVHIEQKNWKWVVNKWPHMKAKYEHALEHYATRQRGEGCGALTKTGQTARLRRGLSRLPTRRAIFDEGADEILRELSGCASIYGTSMVEGGPLVTKVLLAIEAGGSIVVDALGDGNAVLSRRKTGSDDGGNDEF